MKEKSKFSYIYGALILFVCCTNSYAQWKPVGNRIVSEWGMAASKEENDYCHQLEKMLSQNYPNTTVTPLNIAYWERNLNCMH